MRDRRLTPRRTADRRFLLVLAVLFASTFALEASFMGYGYSDARCVDNYRQNVIKCSKSAECGTDMDYQEIDDSLLECIENRR